MAKMKKTKGTGPGKALQVAGQTALTASLLQAQSGAFLHASWLFALGFAACSYETARAHVGGRLERMWNGYADARAKPQATPADAFPQGAIEAARRLLEAPSSEVAEPFGRLVAMYEGKTIDGFFRGTARLLGDVTSDELEELVRLLRALESFDGDDPFFLLAHSVHVRQGILLDVGGSNRPRQGLPNKALKLRHSRRLTTLLRTHTLAEDGKGVAINDDRAKVPHLYTVDTELPRLTAEKLYRVVLGKAPARRPAKKPTSRAAPHSFKPKRASRASG